MAFVAPFLIGILVKEVSITGAFGSKVVGAGVIIGLTELPNGACSPNNFLPALIAPRLSKISYI